MFKRYMMVMVGIAIFGQLNAMKRSLELEEVGPRKKMKTNSAPRESLFDLFKKNDVAGFKREVEWRKAHDKDSLNEKNDSGEPILLVVDQSKKRGSNECFKILLDNGADINARHNRTGMTILSSAASDYDFERMRRALCAGADPNIGLINGVLPLLELSCADKKLYPQRLEVLNTLCAKTDLTKKDTFGRNIMHAPKLQKLPAERLLLYGGDIDVVNAIKRKPQDTCWVPETRQLLESREVVRNQVVMPVMYHLAASQDFKNQDNFPGMPQGVSKLVFNRQIIGPRGLNRNRLADL